MRGSLAAAVWAASKGRASCHQWKALLAAGLAVKLDDGRTVLKLAGHDLVAEWNSKSRAAREASATKKIKEEVPHGG